MDDRYILTRHEIEAFEGLNKIHFLNPNARRTNKSLGDLTGLRNIGVHLIEVPPGCESTELHAHHFEEECVYVLEGKALATIGSETREVGPGDFIGYRAGGKAHKLTNHGETVFKCLVAGQRLDHDVADYPAKNKRLFRNPGMAWDMVDASALEHPAGGQKTR